MKKKALSFLLFMAVSAIMLGKVSDGFFLSKENGTTNESLGIATIEDLTLDEDCSILVESLFKETFDTESTTKDCWVVVDVEGDGFIGMENFEVGKWSILTAPWSAAEGDGLARFFTTTMEGSIESNDDWLISPPLEMDGIYRLKFLYKTGFTGGEFEVRMSVDSDDLIDFTEELVETQYVSGTNGEYLEKIVIIPNVTGTVRIGWHVTSETELESDISIDEVSVELVENCVEPLNLAVEEVDVDSVVITWSNMFEAENWRYVLREQNEEVTVEPEEDGVLTDSNTNTLVVETIDGDPLQPATTYEFFVKTVCDDNSYSIWSGPFVFTTSCSSFSLPFTDGFENIANFGCWTIIDANSDGQSFELTNFESFEGVASIYYSGFGDQGHDDWLISPKLEGTGDYRVRFNYSSQYYDNAFSVKFSDTTIEPESFIEILPSSSMGITNNWDEKTFYLEDVTGEFYIAFHTKDIVGNEPKSLNIDFIRIDEIPSCPEPYEVFVEDITEDSLELSWEQYGDSNSWEVVLLPAGTEFPTDETDLNVIEVNGTPSIVIQDLNAGMLYDIYVRTKCDDEYSVWTDPVKGGTKAINDLCIDSISIPVNQGIDCDEYVSGTLFGASLSDFTDVSCLWDDPESDVWFDFVATSTTLDLTLKSLFNYLVPSPIVQVVVYKGEMCGDLTETVCQESAYDGDTYIRLEDLVIGDRYYIRVLETMDANVFFNVCLTSINSPINVSESDDVYTVEELVKDVFVKSSCDLVSNISWKSGLEYGSNSIGYFEKVDSDFGFEYGIVLATNAIQDVPGPVLEEFEQPFESMDWSGDSDLDDLLIANGNLDNTYNASVLEFDFIPVDENIKFDFIFASNEYGVYQCEYSDIFAFLLTDLESGITTNLAVVPGTTTPISTTTIRREIFSPTDPLNGQILCGDANPEYFDVFYDNKIGVLQKNSPINYAGMTIPMVAEANVIPGKKYHIKLAIQDYKDPNRNSAVFLRGGSFDLGIVDLGGDMLVSENSALCEGGTIVLDTKLEEGEKLEISWLKDGVVIPGEVGLTLEVNEAGVYTFEGKYKEVPSCVLTDSVTVEFYTPLEDLLKAPRDLEFCSNSSSETIDLTQVERDMFIEGIDALEFSFEYYASLEDRGERKNTIQDPTLYSLSTIENSTFYLLVTNNTTACEGYFEFQIKKIAITAPKNPGNQQQCMVYVFPELPENEFYYSEPNAGGIEFLPGDEIDIPGVYEVYIHKTLDNCSAETKFSIIVSQAQEPLEIEDVILQCENYILPELPIGSEYYSEANEGGVRIAAGTEIMFDQTIYVVTKSLEGPNHCVAESSFNVSYKECPIPKGISPNGDGLNDYLDLSTYGVSSLVIYNRYGVEVYSYGMGYTNQWAGQDKSGNLLPDGIYFYNIISHGILKTGWIQINK